MATVDLEHAEQGKTVRIPFIVLNSAGVPFDPFTTSNPFTVTIVNPTVPVGVVTVLTPVLTDTVGKFFVEWSIPLSQADGFYRADILADNGGGPGSYSDEIVFQVHRAGTFSSSSATLSIPDTITTTQRISASRSEDHFVALVRTILRDHPQLNRLTKGRETSDGEIKIAMHMAISMYDSTPPVFVGGASTFTTFPSVGWLVIGTIGWVLNSSWILRQRNNLIYSDGGVSVDSENVASWGGIVQLWWGNYLSWIPQYKVAKNLNDAFGYSPTGVHTEYALLSHLMGNVTFGSANLIK